MASLRGEADRAILRAEEAEAKNKELEQSLSVRDHTIRSLQYNLDETAQRLEDVQAKLNELKQASLADVQAKTTTEGLTRKVQLLEEELDAAEKNLKETVEKCAVYPAYLFAMLIVTRFCLGYDRSM